MLRIDPRFPHVSVLVRAPPPALRHRRPRRKIRNPFIPGLPHSSGGEILRAFLSRAGFRRTPPASGFREAIQRAPQVAPRPCHLRPLGASFVGRGGPLSSRHRRRLTFFPSQRRLRGRADFVAPFPRHVPMPLVHVAPGSFSHGATRSRTRTKTQISWIFIGVFQKKPEGALRELPCKPLYPAVIEQRFHVASAASKAPQRRAARPWTL